MNNVQHFKPVMTHFPANKYRGFIQHCLDNDLEKVKDCLSSGVDVNTVSEDGRWSGRIIANNIDLAVHHRDQQWTMSGFLTITTVGPPVEEVYGRPQLRASDQRYFINARGRPLSAGVDGCTLLL